MKLIALLPAGELSGEPPGLPTLHFAAFDEIRRETFPSSFAFWVLCYFRIDDFESPSGHRMKLVLMGEDRQLSMTERVIEFTNTHRGNLQRIHVEFEALHAELIRIDVYLDGAAVPAASWPIRILRASE